MMPYKTAEEFIRNDLSVKKKECPATKWDMGFYVSFYASELELRGMVLSQERIEREISNFYEVQDG
jgi:hypothetical protein